MIVPQELWDRFYPDHMVREQIVEESGGCFSWSIVLKNGCQSLSLCAFGRSSAWPEDNPKNFRRPIGRGYRAAQEEIHLDQLGYSY